MPGRNPADVLECINVALEERFLRLRRIDPVDRLPRVRQAEGEHVALRLHPGQDHPDVPEIDLRLSPWRMLLRDEHLLQPAGRSIDLEAAPPDVVPDRRIRQILRAVLVSEPGKDAPRGVLVLPWRLGVLAEHLVDDALDRVQSWRRPDPRFPGRWLRL